MSSFMTWWWNKVSKCTILEINENNWDAQLLHDSHTSSPITTHTVRTDLDNWTPQLPNTAHNYTLSMFQSLLGSYLNGQATLYLCNKHLLCWKCIVYPHVMLCHIIKPLGQSIYQGRLHTKLHATPLFKSIWKVHDLNDKVLGMELKRLELHMLCFPPLTVCLLTCVLTGTKLNVQQNTLHHLTP